MRRFGRGHCLPIVSDSRARGRLRTSPLRTPHLTARAAESDLLTCVHLPSPSPAEALISTRRPATRRTKEAGPGKFHKACRGGGLCQSPEKGVQPTREHTTGVQRAGTCCVGTRGWNVRRPSLAAVHRGQPSSQLLFSGSHKPRKGREGDVCTAESCSPLLPPPGRLEPKEHTSLGFKFGPASSFDLRGLSFPGLFICGNHPGFPLLQIHLQEVMPGGGPSEARFTARGAPGSCASSHYL